MQKLKFVLTGLFVLLKLSYMHAQDYWCPNFNDPSTINSFVPVPESGAPSYQWTNVDLNFSFSFYGKVYSEISINPSGFVSFGGFFTGQPPPDVNSIPIENANIIAPFWAFSHLEDPDDGWVYYENGDDYITIVWWNVARDQYTSSPRNSFSLTLGSAEFLANNHYNVKFHYNEINWAQPGYQPAAWIGINGRYDGICAYNEVDRVTENNTSHYLHLCDTFNISAPISNNITASFTSQNSICVVDFQSDVNENGFTIDNYLWDFGDATSSSLQNPSHGYRSDGSYDVKLKVTYNNGCTQDFVEEQNTVYISTDEDYLKDTLLQSTEYYIDNVLYSSIQSYSDAWLNDIDVDILSYLDNGFFSGKEGAWRKKESFTYHTQRKQSSKPNLAEDGTYRLSLLDVSKSDIIYSDKWVNSNSYQKYQSNSQLLQKTNALQIPSAEIYDYQDYLVTATGTNMTNQEMAFSSFEEISDKSGNFTWSSMNVETAFDRSILIANGRFLLVEAPRYLFDNQDRLTLAVNSLSNESKQYRVYRNQTIGCRLTHPEDPDKTILIMEKTPQEGLWTGEVKSQIIDSTRSNIPIDNYVAHAGQSSLKIQSSTTYYQNRLILKPNNEYSVMAWASVNNPSLFTPSLGVGINIAINIYSESGSLLESHEFEPTGKVVEGWQQIDGSFMFPEEGYQLSITFNPGSESTVWFDDMRLFPVQGNMKSFVYDLDTYRLSATLDEENWGTYYFYNDQGNLYSTRIETEEGLKTITENISYVKEIE